MFRVIIAGAGTGSMTVCSQLIRSGKVKPKEIAVIDPSKTHWYQPGYTLAAGGLYGDEKEVKNRYYDHFARDSKSLFHPDVTLIEKSVTNFNPVSNKIEVEGQEFGYQDLIVAIGLSYDYSQVPGLLEAIQDENAPVGTIYEFQHALKINRLIKKFKGGNAIFSQPNQPLKCAGAPQKIMYLAESSWRKTGIRERSKIDFWIPQSSIFGVPFFAKNLEIIAKEKGINLHYEHLLTNVDWKNNKATFKKGDEIKIVDYDFLHTAPPHTPPKVLKDSSIVNQAGFVDINQETMRHVKYNNIWSLGDCSSAPTSKTAAAAISQAPVLVHNILRSWENAETNAKYTGYTSCPIFLGDNKLMLCEFKYQGVPDTTFSSKQNEPSRLAYHLTKDILPPIYFSLLPKGVWYGRDSIFKPKFD